MPLYQPYSYIVCVQGVNALNKPSLESYRLVIKDSVRSIYAVAFCLAAGCLIQRLFVWQCSLLCTYSYHQYTEILELRIFRRLCLQLYVVEK